MNNSLHCTQNHLLTGTFINCWLKTPGNLLYIMQPLLREECFCKYHFVDMHHACESLITCTYTYSILLYHYHHPLNQAFERVKNGYFKLAKWVISNIHSSMTLQRAYKRSRTFFCLALKLKWFTGIRYWGRNINKK